MARTAVGAFGRLSMKYLTYGKPHVARFYVSEFLADVGEGTFTASGSPSSLDALATALTVVMGPLFNTEAGIVFETWRGEKYTPGTEASFVPIVDGSITGGTWTPNPNTNIPGPVSQTTWSFKDTAGHICRFEQFGGIYGGYLPNTYGGLGTAFKAFADYLLGSARIVGRSGLQMSSMIDVTFDTNDALQGQYRR